MPIYRKYYRLQKYYLGEPVMPPIYKKGDYITEGEYPDLDSCQSISGPIIDDEAFMFKINITEVPFTFNLPIINSHDTDRLSVSWGDGKITEHNGKVGTTITGGSDLPASHVFNLAGEYIITCWNDVHRIMQYSKTDPITEIMSWGKMKHITVANAFSENKNLTTIVEDKYQSFSEVLSFNGMFYKCINLKSIPSNLFKYATEAESFNQTFGECTTLKSIPSTLFTTNLKANDFSRTFGECINIEALPYTLFDNQKEGVGVQNTAMFDRTFYNCSNMTGKVIPLWTWGGNQTSDLRTACYYYCFKLDDFVTIPARWQNPTAP